MFVVLIVEYNEMLSSGNNTLNFLILDNSQKNCLVFDNLQKS